MWPWPCVLVGIVSHEKANITHPFNSPFSGTTQVSRYQKGKTNLDFTEARDSEWQWHQLEHMQVCTLLQTDNHANTHHSVFYRPDSLPAAQPTAWKNWRLHMMNSSTKLDVSRLSSSRNFRGRKILNWVTRRWPRPFQEWFIIGRVGLALLNLQGSPKKLYIFQHTISLELFTTRSSAIAEGPRNASCQLKSCQLPRNSAETILVWQVLNKSKL